MRIAVVNHQRSVRLRLPWLRRFARVALEECLPCSADARFALRALAEIEVAIVSDRAIARVHRQFMGIDGATDVLTFAHGEIVIGAGMARANARKFSQTTDREIGLCIIHGLLHLNGFDDRTAAARGRMERAQARVMKTCLERLAGA